MATRGTIPQVVDITYILPTDQLSGHIQIRSDILPQYSAILNYADAKLYFRDGELLNIPNDAIPIEPKAYLSFDIRESNVYTLFWQSDAYMSDDNNKITLRLSTAPLLLQGGTLRSDSIVQNVEIVGTPTVNVGGTVDVELTGTPTVAVSSVSGTVDVEVVGTPDVNVVGGVDVNSSTAFGTDRLVLGSGIISISSRPIRKCVLLSDPSNTANILVGSSASTVTFPLLPGAGMSLDINNLGLLYVSGDSQTLHIAWEG